MTTLPDWLVERAALDEVPTASRDRIAGADRRELDEQIAALRADNAAELARHPAGPAVAEIEARVAREIRQRTVRRRQQRLRWLGVASAAAGIMVAVLVIKRSQPDAHVAPSGTPDEEITRVKGSPRLLAFRHAGDHVERLEQDALVHAGDLIQLRYNPAGQRYGVIASVDGAGVVTLHLPTREDAPPAATALVPTPTALPTAYALDDAPRFERFFFITADRPIDVGQSVAALRALAARADSESAMPELADGLHSWSLRLRKPDQSTNPKGQTP